MKLSVQKSLSLHLFVVLIVALQGSFAQSQPSITWPGGKQVAISLTFDDARESQVEGGTALLDQFGVKATFYVVPAAVEQKLEGWKKLQPTVMRLATTLSITLAAEIFPGPEKKHWKIIPLNKSVKN